MLETVRTLFVWLADLGLYYSAAGGGHKLGEAWDNYSWMQVQRGKGGLGEMYSRIRYEALDASAGDGQSRRQVTTNTSRCYQRVGASC